jgi:hypothetical protein
VFSPTGPGPRAAAGIAFLSSDTFRPNNGRIKFAVWVSAGYSATLNDNYRESKTFFFTVRVKANGKARQRPLSPPT